MVIDIPCIGGAAALGDELVSAELLEMVGDQIHRLIEQPNKLVDPVIAARERRQELPAQIVSQQPEKVRRLNSKRSSAHRVLQLELIQS